MHRHLPISACCRWPRTCSKPPSLKTTHCCRFRIQPTNLLQVTLSQALAGSGFDPAVRTFFSCEGLIYYLPEVSIYMFAFFAAWMGLGATLGAAVRTFFSCEGLIYYRPEVSICTHNVTMTDGLLLVVVH